MHPAFQTPVGYLVLAAALVADPAIGADLDALPALNAAITESSIAGLSSGAFMAVQFATAWSSVIKGVGVTAETPGNAPDALAVIDTSNTAAVLAWMPVSGATLYRISRAGADGNFAPVGSIAASSFADTELAPQTFYRWHVTAIINGSEGTSFG